MTPKDLTKCAVMAALLVAVQFALSFLSGIELVTAVFAAFCYVNGAKRGILTGIAFSLLRCIIFGFYPNVAVLYLIYYPAFAAVLGTVSKFRLIRTACPFILGAMGAISAVLAASGVVRISAVYKPRVTVMLIILSVIFFALCGFSIYMFLASRREGSESKDTQELVTVTALASVMTVFFTLLDDVITPLMQGYSKEAATAYFYGGFLAMLPQTVCAAVSVFALFSPLKKLLAVK